MLEKCFTDGEVDASGDVGDALQEPDCLAGNEDVGVGQLGDGTAQTVATDLEKGRKEDVR